MSKIIACITVAMEIVCVPGGRLSFPFACLRGSSLLLHLLLGWSWWPSLTLCCIMSWFMTRETCAIFHRRKEPPLTTSKFIHFIFRSMWAFSSWLFHPLILICFFTTHVPASFCLWRNLLSCFTVFYSFQKNDILVIFNVGLTGFTFISYPSLYERWPLCI